MTFRPTGGVVAAMTTSLPEAIGGVRNWDYRYCWLRDTTFTLLALTNGGYFDEAAAWQDWLLRALAGSPEQVQIMYGLKGERQLVEWEVDWLAGYENSQAGAHRQRRRRSRCSSISMAKCWTASITPSAASPATPRRTSACWR